MTNPFSSLEHFRNEFNQGLHDLLSKQQLGPFILCLANATNNPKLYQELKPTLEKQYHRLLKTYQSALDAGEQIDAVEEDLLVFLKLHTLGFENIQLTQSHKQSPWLSQFNQLRSFRPRRMTNFAHNGEMFTQFEKSQFHFNKPFMAKECFWQGEYNNKKLDLFYNKYPFADLHGLIVPQRESCLPQFLLRDMHEYIWDMAADLSASLPGVAFGYNSYGAYASVNHLHFQMFIDPQGLPVTHGIWKHNGGKQAYPINVEVVSSVDKSWEIIDQLHNCKQAYNLLYMPNKIYIIPRLVQGSVDVPVWSSGFTWYEMCGAMLVSSHKEYKELDSQSIDSLLNKYSVGTSDH